MRTLFFVLLLGGCAAGSSWNASMGHPSDSSSPPTQTLIVDKQVQGMSRNEVITAVQECEGSGLRAIVLTTKRQINGFATDIIFDITCAPKLKTY
jgi:hypothetical protein